MKSPKIYYFAKLGLEGYANKTEPTLYPHAFVEFVRKEDHDQIAKAFRAVVLAMQPLVNVGCLNGGEYYKPHVAELNEKLADLQRLVPDVAAPQTSQSP